MTISNDFPDLFVAILAMDSYNRGYNEGLIVNGNQIGNATLVQQSDTEQGSAGVNASFFAQAYTWNGQTVISYRGTDVLPGVTDPFFNAASWLDISQWGALFGNNYNASQLRLAAQFYQQIKSQNVGPIETTGHSLGGALAGFVSGIYGENATLFDNIWFTDTARYLYTAVTSGVPLTARRMG